MGFWFGSLAVKKGRIKEGIASGWSECFIPFLKTFFQVNLKWKCYCEMRSWKCHYENRAETFEIFWMLFFFLSYWINVWCFDLELWLALVNPEWDFSVILLLGKKKYPPALSNLTSRGECLTFILMFWSFFHPGFQL